MVPPKVPVGLVICSARTYTRDYQEMVGRGPRPTCRCGAACRSASAIAVGPRGLAVARRPRRVSRGLATRPALPAVVTASAVTRFEGREYQARFDTLAARGVDVHGEASFVRSLQPRHGARRRLRYRPRRDRARPARHRRRRGRRGRVDDRGGAPARARSGLDGSRPRRRCRSAASSTSSSSPATCRSSRVRERKTCSSPRARRTSSPVAPWSRVSSSTGATTSPRTTPRATTPASRWSSGTRPGIASRSSPVGTTRCQSTAADVARPSGFVAPPARGTRPSSSSAAPRPSSGAGRRRRTT